MARGRPRPCNHAPQMKRFRLASSRELEVPALAGKQRPDTAAAGAVVGAAVVVLAVTIVIVAVPAGAARRLGFQHRVYQRDGVAHDWIIGQAQAITRELQWVG